MSPLSNEWEQTFSDVSCRKNKQTEHERKCDECLLGGPDFFFKIKINKNNVKNITYSTEEQEPSKKLPNMLKSY